MTTSVSFSLFWDARMYDWGTVDYTSFIDTNYQSVNDNTFWLDTPYLFIYLKDGTDPDITENSLLTQIAWDWSKADD